MRVLVFFDLPVKTVKNRRDYRIFRKLLTETGFLMMQESVYSKLVQNDAAAESAVAALRKTPPPEGVVQVLKVTEKQYQKMAYIIGEKNTEVLDSDERLVVL